MRKVIAYLTFAVLIPFHSGIGLAQDSLLDDRWFRLETDNFIVISEASARQTSRFAEDLEIWRQITAQIIAGADSFPAANVPNVVFLFDNQESLQHFTAGEELAFFYATPRANFMATLRGEETSMRTALHHYGHFIQRNFSDLRLPRWYEEGMSGYLARMQIDGDGAEFERSDARTFEVLHSLSETLAMDRLLYQDAALASPRLIQIANLKSEALMHYLRHGHEDGWPDRRQQLDRYLQFILEGRTVRFAFDQAFDLTTAELDDEFHSFLIESSRPAGEIPYTANQPIQLGEPERLSRVELAIQLGELALNSGRAENAELFFTAAMESESNPARAYSGLGDALRFQDVSGRDQEIASYFDQALALAPNEPDILLDYGEYWEAELNDCDRTYPAAERVVIIDKIEQSFTQALSLVPDSAEANLAMGQVYLFPEKQWSSGIQYQQKAFDLLPADSFIMEQAAKYAIESEAFTEAEALIDELAQPLHFFGVPGYVNNLRQRLQSKRNNERYEACAE
ncbi:MAG: hypothetical protein MI746_12815 [Pseudomonadales bacterium]|nr:hypothetical protein [Pseudomonadales bacterium]